MIVLYKAKLFKYCRQDLLNNSELPINIDIPSDITYLDYDNFQGFYFIKNKILFFFFHGSNDVKDWIDNFNIKKKDLICNGGNNHCGKVHKGFYNYYKNIQEVFLRVIEYNLHKLDEIHISGYSLGGSCVIAALEASYIDNCPPITVVTFGSPRVGNLKFTKLFNKRIHKSIRVVNDFDPVPRVFSFRFVHVNKLYFLREKIERYNGWFKYKWNKIKYTLFHCAKKNAFVECHDIDEYINKLYKTNSTFFS